MITLFMTFHEDIKAHGEGLEIRRARKQKYALQDRNIQRAIRRLRNGHYTVGEFLSYTAHLASGHRANQRLAVPGPAQEIMQAPPPHAVLLQEDPGIDPLPEIAEVGTDAESSGEEMYIDDDIQHQVNAEVLEPAAALPAGRGRGQVLPRGRDQRRGAAQRRGRGRGVARGRGAAPRGGAGRGNRRAGRRPRGRARFEARGNGVARGINGVPDSESSDSDSDDDFQPQRPRLARGRVQVGRRVGDAAGVMAEERRLLRNPLPVLPVPHSNSDSSDGEISRPVTLQHSSVAARQNSSNQAGPSGVNTLPVRAPAATNVDRNRRVRRNCSPILPNLADRSDSISDELNEQVSTVTARTQPRPSSPQPGPSVVSTNSSAPHPARTQTPCNICLHAVPNIAVIPCGHVHVCEPCIIIYRQGGGTICPSCRSPMTSFIRIYGQYNN